MHYFGFEMKKSIIVILIFTCILAPILVGVVVWEITNQPLIDYKLESSDSLNLHWESYLPVNLMIRNRGGIDASVWLILTVENATIQEIQETNIEYSENKTSVRVFLPKSMEHWGTGKTLNIIPKNNVQTFSIYYDVEKVFDLMSLFSDINPIKPTFLTFNQTQPDVYTKISQ